jgi:transcription elongation factor Elf1
MAHLKTVMWMTVSIDADARKRASFPCSKCGAPVDVSAPIDLDPVQAPCKQCGAKHALEGKKGGDFGG